jgi:hypothetical protein
MKPDDAGQVKQVMLNRIVVGEYVSTGDPKRDSEAALEVLKQKGVYKKLTLQQKMYNQAVSFAAAANDLYVKHLSSSPFNGFATAPFVVNAAFSIEIYLKTLRSMSGETKKKKSHSLLDLYDELGHEVKDAIAAKAIEHYREFGLSSPQGYREHVAHLSNAFETWRYIYEDESFVAVNIMPLIFVMKVLHEVCGVHLKRQVTDPQAP